MASRKSKPNLSLRDERMRRHWSQQELADKVGATLNTVSRWERGLTECSPYFRNKLCEVFGKDAHELWLLPEDESEEQQVMLCDPLLPAPQRLIGRDSLLRQFKQQLCTTWEERTFALTGMPGVGKSALAVALAHDPAVREHFSDGILWADLGPTPPIPALLNHWAALLDVTSSEPTNLSQNEARLLSLRTTIGQRRMLIVVDNVWQLEDALPFLKVGGAYCTFLLTTRFVNIAVHLAGEHILTVPELSEDDGLHLLSRIAPAVVKAEPDSARLLVRAVGGLPLALLLMGQYLRVQSHTQQPRRLSLALERLYDTEKRLCLEQPSLSFDRPLTNGSTLSLQAAIALSDRCLAREAQEALRALSVFPAKPNTFSEQAAIFVSGAPGEVLDCLSDAKLLESQGPERYSLHQCIADYAALHEPQDAAERRLVEYFTDFAEAHSKDHERLQQEGTNILTALKLAYKHQMVVLQIRLVSALFDFLETHGFAYLTREHLQYLQHSIRSVEDFHALVGVLSHLGKLGWIQGTDCNHALYLKKCLHAEHELLKIPACPGEFIPQCQMLSLLGVNKGALETCLSTLLQQVEHPAFLKQLNTQQDQQIPHDPLAASRCLRRALTLAYQSKDVELACLILANLAALAREQKDYAEAERFLEKGMKIATTHEQSRSLLLLLMEKVHLAFAAHKFEETSDVFQQILELVPQEELLAVARYYGLVRVVPREKLLPAER